MHWRPSAACSATKTKDFITAVDEKNIILVKEVKPGETYDDLEKTATSIVDMLNTESLTTCQRGITVRSSTRSRTYRVLIKRRRWRWM